MRAAMNQAADVTTQELTDCIVILRVGSN